MSQYPIIVDFETDPIVGNPLLKPPKPCGVSIKWPDAEPRYFAWGHPTENNCTFAEACDALERVRASGLPFCFHNAGFDLSVWGSMHPYFKAALALIPWHKIHDTLYLIFLQNPYAPSFSLKPSAERILGLPPDEQTELKNWILSNVPQATLKDWAAWICKAPGGLVGKYANGDTTRTDLLFKRLIAAISEQGMMEAYDRERRFFPITSGATKHGVRVDRERLEEDTHKYTGALDQCEGRLCEKIGITLYQLEEDEEALKDGLERCGAVTEWVLTPKSGKRSMADGNLKIIIPEIRDLLDYRGALKTCLQTFMRPWVEMSREDGRLHPNWNQVRQAKGDYDSKGARTGRLSSDDPNFQNLPTDWAFGDGTPMPVPSGLLPYPVLRNYILPEQGHVWLKRDFSSQEVRIAAHFEDGSLKEAYCQDPGLDPHQWAKELIKAAVDLDIARRPTKVIAFSIIYGAGGPGLVINLKKQAGMIVPLEKAYELKSAYLTAMPGINALMEDVKLRGKLGIGIRTWGGRVYLSEPSKIVGGRMRDFHYKLLNYLIQGSAADQTKECIIDWDSDKGDGIFLATVHDEINISAPKDTWNVHMSYLKRVMEKDRFAVPFRSEGFVGTSWGDLKECA